MSENDPFSAFDQALGITRRPAALHADGPCLGDILGNRQQQRHRLERPSQIIHIQSGNNHALAQIGQSIGDPHQVLMEELGFVDPYHVGIHLDRRQDLAGGTDRLGFHLHFGMGDNVFLGVAGIDHRFEDLHFLPGDLSAAQAANQLLALPTEHGAGDDFNPS